MGGCDHDLECDADRDGDGESDGEARARHSGLRRLRGETRFAIAAGTLAGTIVSAIEAAARSRRT